MWEFWQESQYNHKDMKINFNINKVILVGLNQSQNPSYIYIRSKDSMASD